MTTEELRLYALLLAERIEGAKATTPEVLVAAVAILAFLTPPAPVKH